MLGLMLLDLPVLTVFFVKPVILVYGIYGSPETQKKKSCDPFLMSKLCNIAVTACVQTAWRNENSPERERECF